MTRRLILLVADADTGEVMEAGKPSGLVITRKEPAQKELRAGYEYIDGVAMKSKHTWSSLRPRDFWRAMLSASSVDLSGAEVKLPERKNIQRPTEGGGPYDDDYRDGSIEGHNDCLDAITAQMKGE